MIILGIDPGVARTGYGVIKKKIKGEGYEVLSYGCIFTPKKIPLSDRLVVLTEKLTQVIAECSPEEMAVESLFFAANAKTAIDVGQARGAIILTGKKHKIPIFEYTPLEIKMALTGYGRAEKKQIQQMVKVLLSLDRAPEPDDAADALAIAICHGNTNSIKI